MAVLALGYQGGVVALISMGALNMGIPEDELQGIVDMWREANPNICRYWHRVDKLAIECVKTGQAFDVGHGVRFRREPKYFVIDLPAGRSLYYVDPQIVPSKFGGQQIKYKGPSDSNGRWGDVYTYGGKLVENITQAVARDCLADALLTLNGEGFDVAFHVHDEIVCRVKDEKDYGLMEQIMTVVPEWAEGLPVGADGGLMNYYRKE